MKTQNQIKLSQRPVLFENVRFTGGFWEKRLKLVTEKVLPYQWDALNDNIPGAEPSHTIENFRIAAGESNGKFHGMVFQDSDIAKWIEAASYSLQNYPDPELEANIDRVIDLMERAQQEDGYLNTYFTVAKPEERWTDFTFGHELYCAGHLIEAAVAYFNTTRKRKFLDMMCAYCDYIYKLMGPEPHQMNVYCGHEEIELALMKLYHLTGKEEYLKLTEYFIKERGNQPSFLKDEPTFGGEFKDKWFDLDYHQALEPVKQQTAAEGHSVRAMYLYTAMADLAIETGDIELQESLNRLWDNVTLQRMYITGGLGSQGHAERFTFDYDLPNDTAYTETCAAIGLIFWASRMLLLDTDSKYADVMERALYNGVLSGISLDGTKYFYVNPLEVNPQATANRYDLQHVKSERVPWFGCACCPPNIARLISSIGSYFYTQDDQRIYFHLYAANQTNLVLSDKPVGLDIKTDYPWDGDVNITLSLQETFEFDLAFRIPDWCESTVIRVNKEEAVYRLEKGYAVVRRDWKNEDEIAIEFSMNIQFIEANPKVRENAGKVTIQRGPLVYCIEETDNGSELADVTITDETGFSTEYDDSILDGVIVIKGQGVRSDTSTWSKQLYRPVQNSKKPIDLKAVPYFLWGNRSPGEMLVWVRYTDFK